MSKKEPVAKFRSFNISAAVWKQEKGFSVSINKTYKKDDGTYEDTTTFFQDDLPRLCLVANKAFEFMALNSD
jgi:hypothetical protein